MRDDTTETKHESFGLLSFSRTTSSRGTNLFGSSIQHRNTMRLVLSRARLHRHLNYDSYMPDERIIEVEMSPTQFAELITSANIGSGVACTIIWEQGKGRIEDCPVETKRAQFKAEFEAKVKEISAGLSKLVRRSHEILSKPSLLKADREELKSLAETIDREVRANLPFIASQWNEQMDKIVQEAKGETEAFFRNIVEAIGVSHLSEKLAQYLPQLPESDSHQLKQE